MGKKDTPRGRKNTKSVKSSSKKQRSAAQAADQKTLVETVRAYLDALGWAQFELAEETGIPEAQLSRFLTGNRPIDRTEVARLAWALAKGTETLPSGRLPPALFGTHHGLDHLESLLQGLLIKAGFQPKAMPQTDLVWDHLVASPTMPRGKMPQGSVVAGELPGLRFGWFEWAPLAIDRQDGVMPLGLWRDIVSCLSNLLQVRPSFYKLQLSELASAIIERKVDVLMPLIKLPVRTRYMQFSQPLPRLGVGMNAVLRKTAAGSIKTPRSGSARSGKHRSAALDSQRLPQTLNEAFNAEIHALQWSQLEIGYIQAGIAEATLWEIEHQLGLRGLHSLNRRRHFMSLESGFAWAAEAPANSNEPLRCFFADALSCRIRVEESGGELAELFEENSLLAQNSRLPLAMAVHPDEALLLGSINTALSVMKEMGTLDRLLDQSRHSAQSFMKLIETRNSGD